MLPGNRKKMLLRLLPVGGVLLLAGAAFASFIVGLKAEENLTRIVARLHDSREIGIELSQYRRGFFSSRAITRLQPAAAGLEGQTVVHHIWHGPFPLTFLGSAQNRPLPTPIPRLAVISSRGEGDSGTTEPWQARTTINLNGRATTSFQLPPGGHQWGGIAPLNLNWQALEGTLAFPLNLEQLEGELTGKKVKLAILPPAKPAQRLLEMGDFKLRFAYRQEEDRQGGKTLQARQQLAAGRLGTAGAEYGPFSLQAQWHNLDRQATGRLFSLAPWWRQLLLGPGQPPQGEIPPPTAQKMVETLSDLLAKAPSLEIDPIKLQTAHGEAAGRLRLAYRGRDDNRPFHPIMLLSGLEAEISAEAPPPLAASLLREQQQWQQQLESPGDQAAPPAPRNGDEKWEEPLAGLLQRGLLAHDEELNQVSFQLHYQAGELTINQRPAPFQALRHLLP